MKLARAKLVRASGALGLVALAVMTSSLAVAAESGWYGGFGLGSSKVEIDDARITSGLLRQGLTTTAITNGDRSTGYKLFAGYQLNTYFALEGGYFDLGKFGFTAATVPAGTLTGKIKLRGYNLDAVVVLPLVEKLSVFGRGGFIYAEADDFFSGTGAVVVTNPRPSKGAPSYKFGAGLQYDFTRSLGLRIEAERYRVDDAVGNKGDVDLYSAGLIYRFGRETPAPAPRAAAPVATPPAPVIPPPAPVVPPPAPVIPPPTPLMAVTLSSDSFFDFDKASVRPGGKQRLDKLAADLRGIQYDTITVTGHTDRIGSRAYNMKLSTRRAEAVKAYLVESGGIPAVKIITKGVDGDNPVTKPGQCPGKKVTKKLIACLQPDRRVEVEVFGTK